MVLWQDAFSAVIKTVHYSMQSYLLNDKISKPEMKRVIVFLCSVCVLLLGSCLDKYNTYGIVDIPFVNIDGRYFICIVAESNATIHMENGGYNKTSYRTTYWLKKYETATGKLIKKKELLDYTDNPDIGCYGSFDNKIWLYVNGIVAYDMDTLEKLMGEKEIAASNGVKKTMFPYGSRLVNAFVEKGFIDFTADNGEQYRLNLKDQKIINKENIKEEEGDDEEKETRLFREDEYGARCDTFNNAVFILANDIAAAEQSRPNNYDLHETAYRMKMFKAAYAIRKVGNHNLFEYENMIQAGNSTYLNPCFAQNIKNYKVLHLSNPGGYLLIHQTVLGEKSKAIFTRIDTNNNKVWETTSDVSTKISSCTSNGKYCIITTNKAYMLSPHIGKDALCIIDTETGKVVVAGLDQ